MHVGVVRRAAGRAPGVVDEQCRQPGDLPLVEEAVRPRRRVAHRVVAGAVADDGAGDLGDAGRRDLVGDVVHVGDRLLPVGQPRVVGAGGEQRVAAADHVEVAPHDRAVGRCSVGHEARREPCVGTEHVERGVGGEQLEVRRRDQGRRRLVRLDDVAAVADLEAGVGRCGRQHRGDRFAQLPGGDGARERLGHPTGRQHGCRRVRRRWCARGELGVGSVHHDQGASGERDQREHRRADEPRCCRAGAASGAGRPGAPDHRGVVERRLGLDDVGTLGPVAPNDGHAGVGLEAVRVQRCRSGALGRRASSAARRRVLVAHVVPSSAGASVGRPRRCR